MSAASDRRRLVNASVVAGSAVMFAAAWAGIVRADQDAAVSEATVVAVVEAPSVLAGPDATDAPAVSTPTQRVVVVRESRAS